MSEIIKIKDLKLLCVPTFKKIKKKEKNMITRIELTGKERIHFVQNQHQIHFRNLKYLGFESGAKIRYFEHDKDNTHKFYIQVKSLNDFNLLSEIEKKQFFTLSKDKKDTATSGAGLWNAMFIGAESSNIISFDSEKLAQVLSDDGYLLEVDVTKYMDFLSGPSTT